MSSYRLLGYSYTVRMARQPTGYSYIYVHRQPQNAKTDTFCLRAYVA